MLDVTNQLNANLVECRWKDSRKESLLLFFCDSKEGIRSHEVTWNKSLVVDNRGSFPQSTCDESIHDSMNQFHQWNSIGMEYNNGDLLPSEEIVDIVDSTDEKYEQNNINVEIDVDCDEFDEFEFNDDRIEVENVDNEDNEDNVMNSCDSCNKISESATNDSERRVPLGNKAIDLNDASEALVLFLSDISELPMSSPLRKELISPNTPDIHQGYSTNVTKKNLSSSQKKNVVRDLPVTFHSRIKSSGYGQVSNDLFVRKQQQKQKRQMEKQRLLEREKLQKRNEICSFESPDSSIPCGESENNDTCQPNSSNTNNGKTNSSNNGMFRRRSWAEENIRNRGPLVGNRIRSYPLDCQPMTSFQPQNLYPKLSSISQSSKVASNASSNSLSNDPTRSKASLYPIHRIEYNNDASVLGFASNDNTVTLCRLPIHRYGDSGKDLFICYRTRSAVQLSCLFLICRNFPQWP